MAKKSSKVETSNFKLSKKFLSDNKFTISGLILGLILLVIGIVQLLANGDSGTQIEIVPAESQVETAAGKIVVDVAGAVNRPGVYTLEAGSRVANAVETAGNFSGKADLGWVAKNLNMAAKLTDSAKIYIPAKGETSNSTLGIGTVTPVGKINLNTASQSELESLPGVGPVTAVKIISGRPYNSTAELLTKKVVGKSTFEKIKDLVSVF